MMLATTAQDALPTHHQALFIKKPNELCAVFLPMKNPTMSPYCEQAMESPAPIMMGYVSIKTSAAKSDPA
jgi:hypothetical protein